MPPGAPGAGLWASALGGGCRGLALTSGEGCISFHSTLLSSALLSSPLLPLPTPSSAPPVAPRRPRCPCRGPAACLPLDTPLHRRSVPRRNKYMYTLVEHWYLSWVSSRGNRGPAPGQRAGRPAQQARIFPGRKPPPAVLGRVRSSSVSIEGRGSRAPGPAGEAQLLSVLGSRPGQAGCVRGRE